jgi:hypothetical protein
VSVKQRMDEMLTNIGEAGSDGVEMGAIVKVFYERWGFRLSTIKSYISDLEELGKIRIIGSRIYHSEYQTPRGLISSTR